MSFVLPEAKRAGNGRNRPPRANCPALKDYVNTHTPNSHDCSCQGAMRGIGLDKCSPPLAFRAKTTVSAPSNKAARVLGLAERHRRALASAAVVRTTIRNH